MNEKLDAKISCAFDRLLDDRLDMYGVFNTIAWLMDQCDFTKEDLLAIKFDEEYVDYVIEHPEVDYGQEN